jgi:predicted transcriptional regulator
MPEPKPAYNTVSTTIRIMEGKGFVAHNAYGKTYEYYPLISKEEYTSKSLKNLVSEYFDDSYKNLISFFSKEESISVKDLEAIKRIIEEEINNKKESL